MALVVGGMICVAAANYGRHLAGPEDRIHRRATPRYQQLALFEGPSFLPSLWALPLNTWTPTSKLAARGIQHAIGKNTRPAATLMATLIKGIMGHNLDWNFVLVGVFIAIFMELCGIKASRFPP